MTINLSDELVARSISARGRPVVTISHGTVYPETYFRGFSEQIAVDIGGAGEDALPIVIAFLIEQTKQITELSR